MDKKGMGFEQIVGLIIVLLIIVAMILIIMKIDVIKEIIMNLG